MDLDISFIISLYNQSIQIFERCLNSLENLNSGIKYEIIIVDDGSKPENTRRYKKSLKSKSLNVTFFHKENGGVSSARNFGILHSKGKYICFMDVDDEEIVENINISSLNKNLNLLIYDVGMKNLLSNKTKRFSLNENTQVIPTLKLSRFLLKDGLLNWVFGKFYSRSFLLNNKLYFDESMKTGEDYCFNLNVLAHTLSIGYINKILYIYNYDPNSDFLRKVKFPLICLKNAVTLYNLRLGVLNRMKNKEKSKLNENLVSDLVDSIFYCYVGSIVGRKKSINKECINAINTYTKSVSLNFSSKLKVMIMRSNSKYLVNVYLKIKNIYRKIRPYEF